MANCYDFSLSLSTPIVDCILNLVPSYSGLFLNDSPIYSLSSITTSSSCPFLHPPLLLANVAFHLHLGPFYDSSMLTLLSPLSCTILRLIVAGLSQAPFVFNLSYVQ